MVEGSVIRARQSIHLGQSSMSAALARLRQHFNDELLIRVGRDYELTPVGLMHLDQMQLALRHRQSTRTDGNRPGGDSWHLHRARLGLRRPSLRARE